MPSNRAPSRPATHFMLQTHWRRTERKPSLLTAAGLQRGASVGTPAAAPATAVRAALAGARALAAAPASAAAPPPAPASAGAPVRVCGSTGVLVLWKESKARLLGVGIGAKRGRGSGDRLHLSVVLLLLRLLGIRPARVVAVGWGSR